MEQPPPLPILQQEALLRGPLILTAISRVLLIPFYLLCTCGATGDLWRLSRPLREYRPQYLADKFLLAIGMSTLLLLSVLLAWLFFSRRRAFRPLMIYFCCLLPPLIACVAIHMAHFRTRQRAAPPAETWYLWAGVSMLVFLISGLFWPFYYAFSRRVKRVFTR